jgi:(2Fe-2S) ferredoxin
MTHPVLKAPVTRHVFVCTGKSCQANNSEATLEAFKTTLKACELLFNKLESPQGQTIVTYCGSVGLCEIGPAVLVYPDGVWYQGISPDKVSTLVTEHLVKGQVVESWVARRVPSGSNDPSLLGLLPT